MLMSSYTMNFQAREPLIKSEALWLERFVWFNFHDIRRQCKVRLRNLLVASYRFSNPMSDRSKRPLTEVDAEPTRFINSNSRMSFELAFSEMGSL